VKLIYYLEKMMGEQAAQLNNAISNLEKQLEIRLRYLAEAVDKGEKILDERFVKLDRFAERTSGFDAVLSGIKNTFDSSLADLGNRMTILETESKVTAKVAAAEMTKMVIWLGLFFTAVQIVLHIIDRKDKPKEKEIKYVRVNDDNRPVEPR